MTAKRDRVPPLLRAFALLEHVAAADGPVALQDLTVEAGLPKPTVYRMLATLEAAGLVTREPDGRRITAGPRLMRFALDVQLSAAVRAPRHAILKRLADHLGETVNLTMLDGSEVVYLDRVETEWPLRMTLQPGSHVPLHCTASGKLFLAEMPAAEREALIAQLPLTRMTRQTITSARALKAECAAIAAQGHSSDREEFIAGLIAVAVPVRDESGRTRAAIALHAPSARLSLAEAQRQLPALRAATAQMATLL